MKKTIFILTVFLFSFISSSQNADFIGKWRGVDKGEIGYIIFDDQGYASFEIGGEVLGGKEFTMDGQKGKMTYTINTKTHPIQIDFTLTKIETGENIVLSCIAELIDKDTINFSSNFNSTRPTSFVKENTLQLKRIK